MEATRTVKLVRLFWTLILGSCLVLGALWALTPPSVAQAQGPAPDLRVEKWVEGNGQATPGGPVVFSIRYQNNGLAAGQAILTDTLPASTTYASDSSGFQAFVAGGVVTWNLGLVQPYTLPHEFQLVLANTAEEGDRLTNAVDIGAPYETNPGDNRAEAGIDIASGQPNLYVDKYPNPGDPTPGQLFRYEINYGNQGPVASGPVWLTDTLPASTTFVGWASENNYNLWSVSSSGGGQVALHADALPGNFGDRIFLTLRLDDAVSYDTQLTNTVEIATAGDSDLNNNQRTNADARASRPRYNLSAGKSWSNGSLVPGGELTYWLNANNNGNSAVPGVVMTDTLPDGVTFITSTFDLGWGIQPPVTPSYNDGHRVAWNLGDMAVNGQRDIRVQLRIDSGIAPGTVLTNCLAVSAPPGDENLSDNTRCIEETVRDHGPNLRVVKRHEWRDNKTRLHYEVNFENIGDEAVAPVVLTDTYPLSTTLAGDPWWDFWRNISWTHDDAERQLIFEIEELQPGWNARLWFDVTLDEPDARPRWYTNTAEISAPSGETNAEDNTYVDEAFKVEVERAEIWMNSDGSSNMWGRVVPDAPVTVTTAADQFTTTANGNGDWNIDNAGMITPGDTITVEAGSGRLPVIFGVPNPFSAQASSASGAVWGQVGGAANKTVEVYGNWPDGYQAVPADVTGAYSATYAAIPRGGDGNIRYLTQVSYADVIFHRAFQSPDLMLTANYAHDWVETEYAPGYTLWITVTNSLGEVKATMMDTTGVVPWWGDRTGFSTDMGTWSPGRPDIAPGDWVYGALSNGFTSSVRVGTISGTVDTANDRLSGAVTADWFTQALKARCWVDGVDNSNQDFTVDPDGGSYACDFAGIADLVPGQNVSVQYQEPDGDWVRNVFQEPAPDLRVEKWAEGSGQSFPGGPVIFNIRYQNNGQAAGQAILTDTLPANTVYASDTSGLTPFVAGGVITWNLGVVQPYTLPVQFQLVLTNSAEAGDDLLNQVDIGALYDNNLGDNHAEATVHVAAGQPDLYVNKYPNPGDPAPGQLFRYDINYGNQAAVASGPVWLTDTLPAGTTFVGWMAQNQPNPWSLVSSGGGQVVLYAPALPGNYGDQIRLTLRLGSGVAQGTQLVNTIEITTAADSEPTNNHATNGDAYVKPLRYNAGVEKWWSDGSLAVGREASYWIAYHNWGNSLMHDAVLTDTLPEGVDFVSSELDLGWGVQIPFPPTHQAGRTLTWDLGNQDVNAEQNIRITMRIRSSTTPGSVLTNCATIAVSDFEDNPYDNTACTADTVRAAGPDLGVIKSANWEGTDGIRYRVAIRNVGTSTEYNVAFTDTYDSALTPDGCNVKYWRDWQWSGCSSGTNPITMTLSQLDPGDTVWLEMRLRVPGGISKGVSLANTAEVVTPPGDVHPEDNHVEVVVGTGPDLSIEKRLSGGASTPRPGGIVTYTLHFENDSPWGTNGNVLVTDTLPAGLEFVAAQQRQCDGYNCPHDPKTNDGTSLVWDYGQWGGNQWNDLVLTLRVSDTLRSGTVLTNHARIATGKPGDDVEPNYANNASRLAVTVGAMPPGGLAITGPITGVVGTSYVFTATVSPTNTALPITYTWRATGQSPVTYTGGGLTRTVSFTWSVGGVKTVTATAANVADVVTATYTIIIEASGNRPVYLPIIRKNAR